MTKIEKKTFCLVFYCSIFLQCFTFLVCTVFTIVSFVHYVTIVLSLHYFTVVPFVLYITSSPSKNLCSDCVPLISVGSMIVDDPIEIWASSTLASTLGDLIHSNRGIFVPRACATLLGSLLCTRFCHHVTIDFQCSHQSEQYYEGDSPPISGSGGLEFQFIRKNPVLARHRRKIIFPDSLFPFLLQSEYSEGKPWG